MHRPSVYLDTSVVNFLFADDAPEKKEITIDFFDNFIRLGLYETFVSDFVLQEIMQTPDENHKNRLLNVLDVYPINLLEITAPEEIDQLANQYLAHEIIPAKKLFDALHVAASVVHRIDYLVSWNYKHLSNVNRERRILALNYQLNYLHPLRISTPLDLLGYGN